MGWAILGHEACWVRTEESPLWVRVRVRVRVRVACKAHGIDACCGYGYGYHRGVG